MVRLADDAHLVPRDALKVLDSADRDPLGVEHRALLDVQLDVRVRPVQRQPGLAAIADARQAMAAHSSAAAACV